MSLGSGEICLTMAAHTIIHVIYKGFVIEYPIRIGIERKAMRTVLKTLIAVSMLFLTSAVQAADLSEDSETKLKTCQAATWDAQQAQKEQKRSKRGPVRRAVRSSANFIGNEVGQTAQGIGRDLVFCLSVQDIDPYERKAPTNKPYQVANFRTVDGGMCSLTKYPDSSCRVDGGFADGTIIAPTASNEYVVGYPNGARGKLVKTGSQVKVYRPDKTVTTFEKTLSGNYKIHNSKIGYMGEGLVDQTGMRFDFGSFGSGTL